MKSNNKGFAYSTMLYGLLAVMMVLLMLIFNLYKRASDEEYYYSSLIDVKLNQCVDAEIALENCYAANAGECDFKEYYACLGITKNAEDAKKVSLYDTLTQSSRIVTSGNGLYKISDEEYVYRGDNVNNFITFGGKMWRIIGIYNGRAKLADVSYSNAMKWDADNSQEWTSSTLEVFLNDSYFNNLLKREVIPISTWSIGRINTSIDLDTIKNAESSASYNGFVGLLGVSDLMAASTNAECHNAPFADAHNCRSSYLAAYTTWLINATPSSDSPTNAYYFKANEGFVSAPTSTEVNVIPVIYLDGAVTINGSVGDGTTVSPYVVLS